MIECKRLYTSSEIEKALGISRQLLCYWKDQCPFLRPTVSDRKGGELTYSESDAVRLAGIAILRRHRQPPVSLSLCVLVVESLPSKKKKTSFYWDGKAYQIDIDELRRDALELLAGI